MERDSRHYEAVLIVSPDLNEEAISKVQAQFSEQVSRQNGRVQDIVNLGKRRLNFRIKKWNEAVYLQARLELPPAEIVPFKRAVAMMEPVLRLLIVHAAPGSNAPGLESSSPAAPASA